MMMNKSMPASESGYFKAQPGTFWAWSAKCRRRAITRPRFWVISPSWWCGARMVLCADLRTAAPIVVHYCVSKNLEKLRFLPASIMPGPMIMMAIWSAWLFKTAFKARAVCPMIFAARITAYTGSRSLF